MIRQLRAGQRIPEGEPKRYRSGHGYVRLRWRVAPLQYLEVYEHRVVDGRVTEADEVHHENKQRDDNRPENLEPLTRAEHRARHDAERERRYAPYRSREAMEKAKRAELRRAERKVRAEAMASDYRDGMTTIEVGEKYGVHCSNVSRELRSVGVVLRASGRNSKARTTGPGAPVRQAVHGRDEMTCQRCGRSVKWDGGQIHHRKPRSMGGTKDPAINDPANLVLVCNDCHGHIESYREQSYELGWLLSYGQDPTQIPVLRFGRTWEVTDGTGWTRVSTPKEVPL